MKELTTKVLLKDNSILLDFNRLAAELKGVQFTSEDILQHFLTDDVGVINLKAISLCGMTQPNLSNV